MTNKQKILEQKAKEWQSSFPWYKRIFTKIEYNKLHNKIIVYRDSKKNIKCIDTWPQQLHIIQYIISKEGIDKALEYFDVRVSEDLDAANTIGGKRAQLRFFILRL